jgi:hypothetical protein
MLKGMDGIVLGCFYSLTGIIEEEKKISKCKYLPRSHWRNRKESKAVKNISFTAAF